MNLTAKKDIDYIAKAFVDYAETAIYLFDEAYSRKSTPKYLQRRHMGVAKRMVFDVYVASCKLDESGKRIYSKEYVDLFKRFVKVCATHSLDPNEVSRINLMVPTE